MTTRDNDRDKKRLMRLLLQKIYDNNNRLSKIINEGHRDVIVGLTLRAKIQDKGFLVTIETAERGSWEEMEPEISITNITNHAEIQDLAENLWIFIDSNKKCWKGVLRKKNQVGRDTGDHLLQLSRYETCHST